MLGRLGERFGFKKKEAPQNDKAYDAMEKRIEQIHYYYRNADLSPEIRQVMAYRKLMELEYFTPHAAKELMKQWKAEAERVPEFDN